MKDKLTPLLPNSIYHIYNRANGSEKLFRTDENYRYFLRQYFKYINPIAKTYAYCLMPNHFHFMVQIKDEVELVSYFKKKKKLDLGGLIDLRGLLSQQFSNLFNSYSKAYNKRYERKGNLFMHRFKRKVVDDDDYFTQLVIYIHKNPIHHNLCNNLNDWEHSSYKDFLSAKVNIIEANNMMTWFGNMNSFLNCHETENDLISFDF